MTSCCHAIGPMARDVSQSSKRMAQKPKLYCSASIKTKFCSTVKTRKDTRSWLYTGAKPAIYVNPVLSCFHLFSSYTVSLRCEQFIALWFLGDFYTLAAWSNDKPASSTFKIRPEWLVRLMEAIVTCPSIKIVILLTGCRHVLLPHVNIARCWLMLDGRHRCRHLSVDVQRGILLRQVHLSVSHLSSNSVCSICCGFLVGFQQEIPK